MRGEFSSMESVGVAPYKARLISDPGQISARSVWQISAPGLRSSLKIQQFFPELWGRLWMCSTSTTTLISMLPFAESICWMMKNHRQTLILRVLRKRRVEIRMSSGIYRILWARAETTSLAGRNNWSGESFGPLVSFLPKPMADHFSMARAILKRNKVLFMDEATASIDCKSWLLPKYHSAC